MHARLIKLFCLFVLLTTFQTKPLKAQNSTLFENISTQQGLSEAHVNQVIQDQKGFIWIATANGLNRYDGVDITVFQKEAENKHSLSGNNIRCLLEDSEGYIWVGTLNNGLNRYDYKTGAFTQFFQEAENGLSSNEILSLFEDSQKRLWVGTENGLNLYDNQTNTFTAFLPNEKDENSLKSKAILTIGEDGRGWIWVGTWDGGLNLVIPTNDSKVFKFRHFLKGNSSTDLKSNHIWKLFLDKEQRLWLGTYAGGLSVMLPNTTTDPNNFTPTFQTFRTEEDNHPINNNLIFGVNQDKDGQIWAASVDGLSVFSPITKNTRSTAPYVVTHVKHYRNEYFKSKSLIHNEMRDIFIDDAGLIWCSTLGGISKFDKNTANFKHFLEEGINGENIPVTALTKYDKHTFYIGSRAKLGLIEYNTKQRTFVSHYNSIDDPIYPSTEFISFFKAHTDTLWIGTRTGIVHFNPRTKEFVKNYRLKHPEGKELTNLHARKIIRNRKGGLWLATGAGLVSFDVESEKFTFLEKDSRGNSLSNSDINDLLIEEDKLWLATYNGLIKVEFTKNEEVFFTAYLNDQTDPKSICSNRVMSLVLYEKELWIGTENGLTKYNEATDDFKTFRTKEGKQTSNIISMVVGNDDKLWLGTRKELTALHLKQNEVIHFNEKDGLQTGAFSQNAVVKDGEDIIYMGGINGYMNFKSEEIKLNTKVPPVFITAIKVFNKNIAWGKDVTNLKRIVLQPNQSYFTIEFAALNYSQSTDNQYAYMLEGFNDDWVYCGNQKSVSFSNLDGGTYTFKVKGSNNDDIWNETAVTLQITVIPPIWEQVWFQLFLMGCVIGLGFAMYYSRIQREEHQKKVLKKEVELRTKEITIQKQKIEDLVEELQQQNDHLEELVEERTKSIKRSNIELKRSNEALEQFAYVASHDLQEPLRTVGNFAQLFERRYKNKVDENGQAYIEFIVDGAKRMSSLIQSLLAYSKVGRSDAKFQISSLNTIVKKKLSDLSLRIKEKNAKIVVANLPDEVFCEPNQIGIVFYNLINNGLKFNKHENPKVELQLEKEDEAYWTFSVTDNGIGIDEAYQEKVFEIFKRLHVRSEFEGNGIGLALCKRIIYRHEGDIWFTSKQGEGTTFYFTIAKKQEYAVIASPSTTLR